MKNVLYVRNPQTGLLDVKEFASESQLSILRIADPVSTALVQGYSNSETIGDKLFTPVRMAKETGRFPAFGKEAFVIPGDIKRDVGGKVARISTQSGYVTMSLSEYALGVQLENRERNEWAGSPDMLLTSKLMQVTQKIALYREKLQAVLATTYSNYASGLYASGASKAWGSTGDPVKDMLDLNWLIAKTNGRPGNVAWFSPAAWLLFINNAAVLNRIKYGGSPITPAQMSTRAAAELLQVEEVLVGKAVYGTPSLPGADGAVKKSALTMAFVWDSVQSSNAGIMIRGTGGGIEPAFGYTWERMNSPVVESYYENATKSQVWDYEHFFDPAITLNTAGGIYYSIA